MEKKLVYILILVLSSCTWSTRDIERNIEHRDLVKEFDLKDKKFDQFREREYVVDDVKKPVKKKKTKPKKTVVEKNESKKVDTKKIEQEKPVEVKTEKITLTKAEINKKKNDKKKQYFNRKLNYPKDIPDEFKEYDRESRNIWKQFKPVLYKNERFHIDIRYFGMTAGRAIIQTKGFKYINDELAYHFKVNVKSAPVFKWIYTLDDSLNVFVDKDLFLPIKYSLLQDESRQKVTDLQIFNHKEFKTYSFYKRIKEGKTKKENKEVLVPYFMLDSFSPLFFVRGLPLNNGDSYKFPVVTRGKLWLIDLEVIRREKIRIGNDDVEAIRIRAETQFPGVLKKRGDIIFWYSTDKYRKFLKFEAKVKIGTVEGVLVQYDEGPELINDQ